jgi:hypothetical protein
MTFLDLAKVRMKPVLFEGSTAVYKGDPFCYNLDYGTATTETQSRMNRVEVPSSTNSHRFAGTALYDYPAVTGGQEIVIAEPGGYGYAKQCMATSLASNITPGTRMTFEFTSGYGYFGLSGFMGRGTVEALQTKAVSSDGPLVFSALDSGSTYAHSTKTITDSGSGSTAGVAAGDTVVVLGGSTDDAAATLTAGEYTVASVGAGTIVLSTSPASTGDAWYINYFVIRKSVGRPSVPVYLFDGQESGGVEYVSFSDNTAASATVNGLTILCGGATLTTGDASVTLTDGTWVGQRKGYKLIGAITTQTFDVHPNSNNIKYAAASSISGPSHCQFAAANDTMFVEWNGTVWVMTSASGLTFA